jgi:hypothetical protein
MEISGCGNTLNSEPEIFGGLSWHFSSVSRQFSARSPVKLSTVQKTRASLNGIKLITRSYCTSSFDFVNFLSGDSYSSIDYDVSGPYPSLGNPIGNPAFPGITYSAGSNWVCESHFASLTEGWLYNCDIQ